MTEKNYPDNPLLEIVRELGNRLSEVENRSDQLHFEIKWLESCLRERTHRMNERMKELRCLYVISGWLRERTQDPALILQKIVEYLPNAWQFPQATSARISIDSAAYSSRNFRELGHKMNESLTIKGERRGQIEIRCVKSPGKSSSPFLDEEREMLAEIARRLESFLSAPWRVT